MNTSVQTVDDTQVLAQPVHKDTASVSVYDSEAFQLDAREEAHQYYMVYSRGRVAPELALSNYSKSIYRLLYAGNVLFAPPTRYFRTSPLGRLEKRGLWAPFLTPESVRDDMLVISDIALTWDARHTFVCEELTLPAEQPPHDHFVDGTMVDWSSALRLRKKINILRKNHGLKPV